MEDRIKINGEWYVKEQKAEGVNTDPLNLIETEYKGRVYESEKYYFKASLIMEDDDISYYDGCSIEFTDKRINPWREDYFDNESWFFGLLDGNEENLREIPDMMCQQGFDELVYVIKDLIERGWLKRK
jgi:hypothetical protein